MKPPQRFIYVDNCSNIPSNSPLFSGYYDTLEEIKCRLFDFIPENPSFRFEFYNKRLGMKDRKLLVNGIVNKEDQVIYVYLRSNKPMTCSVCMCSNN